MHFVGFQIKTLKQIGQVFLSDNQVSMHLQWKECIQGKSLKQSPTSY